MKRIARLLNSALGRFGLRLTRVVDPNKILDPAARSIALGLSTREHNLRENMDAFYSDPNLLTHYFTPERLAFYASVRGRLMSLGIDPRDVLDVGCGSGHLLAQVRDVFPRATLRGVDFSPESIRVARGLHSDIRFEECSIFELDGLNATFDLVLCTEVLEHLEKADVALDNLLRVCRPHGLVVVTVPDGRTDTFAGHFNFWTVESFRREFRRVDPLPEQMDSYLFVRIPAGAVG